MAGDTSARVNKTFQNTDSTLVPGPSQHMSTRALEQ
jgi:hypothetical protein